MEGCVFRGFSRAFPQVALPARVSPTFLRFEMVRPVLTMPSADLLQSPRLFRRELSVTILLFRHFAFFVPLMLPSSSLNKVRFLTAWQSELGHGP